MNVRQSVLGEIAVRADHTNIVTSVDIGALVRRMMLFDRVIVKSVRLRELPALVRSFGEGGLRDLINLGLLQFSCDYLGVVSDIARNGIRSLPPRHFSLGLVKLADLEGTLRREFRGLRSVTGLKNQQRLAIEEAVWKSLIHYPEAFGQDLLDQIDKDLRSNSPALKAGIVEQLRRRFPEGKISGERLDIRTEETQHRNFRIDTSICQEFGLSEAETHKILQLSVSAVANLNQRLSEMVASSALTGFLDSEAPLLFGKLAGIIAPSNPQIPEEQFKRVIEIANVPDFKAGQKVDIEKLLKLRETDECRAFRNWLTTTAELSDQEIHALTLGMKSRLSSLASSPGGKVIRLAATTAVGLIPVAGLALGPASSALDSFLVDRFLRNSGIVAFLTEKYPSLFLSA